MAGFFHKKLGILFSIIVFAVFMLLYISVSENKDITRRIESKTTDWHSSFPTSVPKRQNDMKKDNLDWIYAKVGDVLHQDDIPSDKINTQVLDLLQKVYKIVSEEKQNCSNQPKQTDNLVTAYKPKKSYELVGQRILSRLEDVSYEDVKLAGKSSSSKRFVTIAVPTVNRPQVGPLYLYSTLNSLIVNSSPEEKQRILVVIYLADKDPEYNKALLMNLTQKYPEFLKDGFMNIIQAPSDFYPDFKNLKQNFGDSVDRVKWRSREVIDSAYTYYMCRNFSEYFIQLEDDVLSIPSFLPAIEEYIQSRQGYNWTILDLSAHGSVGKLVRSSDLMKMAIFMFTFYEEQPVDWLMTKFFQTLAQPYAMVRKPIIFQHMGKMSSFDKNGRRAIREVDPHFKQTWKDVKR